MMRRRILLACFFVMIAANARASDPAVTYYRQNCMSCHTIGGGRLVGPDLKAVSQRKDPAWLVKFIVNPQAFLDAGDPYALKLKEEARGAVMPRISGLNEETAGALLRLIDEESKLEKSQFIGLNLGDQPFNAGHVREGERIFTGTQRLANGGPACIACHAVDRLPAFGGGLLGPDLTKVYERLTGRKNLASWLMAPSTPTMRPLFADQAMTNDEIVALVAYFEASAKRPPVHSSASTLSFFFLGLGGAVAMFLGADAIWRKRFRGVRQPLVRGDR